MKAPSRIPFTVHGAIEMLTGLGLLVAPFALKFEDGTAVAAVTAGALLIGLSLMSFADSTDRPALALSAHARFDFAAVLGLLIVAILVALSGDPVATLSFVAAGVTQFALSLTTRYSATA
jgi:hypothetical protein